MRQKIFWAGSFSWARAGSRVSEAEVPKILAREQAPPRLSGGGGKKQNIQHPPTTEISSNELPLQHSQPLGPAPLAGHRPQIRHNGRGIASRR